MAVITIVEEPFNVFTVLSFSATGTPGNAGRISASFCTKHDFGTAWRDGDIIGFALDMRTAGSAVMSVSLNGSFEAAAARAAVA